MTLHNMLTGSEDLSIVPILKVKSIIRRYRFKRNSAVAPVNFFFQNISISWPSVIAYS